MIDKLRYWIINIPNLPTMLAFRVLRRSIARDPAYAYSWQANIAMAIYDESPGMRLDPVFCNNAASRFMRLCFDLPERAVHES